MRMLQFAIQTEMAAIYGLEVAPITATWKIGEPSRGEIDELFTSEIALFVDNMSQKAMQTAPLRFLRIKAEVTDGTSMWHTAYCTLEQVPSETVLRFFTERFRPAMLAPMRELALGSAL